jgi:site-specific DNA-cytosine methylase
MTYTVGTACSGIAVPDLAASMLGMDVRYHVEIEDFPRKVIQRHAGRYWPNATLFSDVRECGAHNLETVDIFAAGFPCSDVSFAGKRAGMGAGTRTGLWWEIARIIRETQPRVVFLENVPGILSPIRARKACFTPDPSTWFIRRAFVTRTVAPAPAFQVAAQLRQMGYVVRWGIIAASDFGAPHRRERWWCVAYANVRGWPEEQSWHKDGIAGRRQQLADATNAQSQQSQDNGPEQTSFVDSVRSGHRIGGRNTPTRVPLARRTAAGRAQGMAHSLGKRRSSRRTQRARPHRRAAFVGAGHVGHAQRRRLDWHARGRAGQNPAHGHAWDERAAFARLGRNPHDAADRLDFVGRWPARPGESQHDWEPPRVVAGGVPNRAARLKALGNAMVLPVVYAIMGNILAWLQAQDAAAERAA